MHHDVCSVEDVMPVGDALHIDEVNDTSVKQAVQNVAAAASDDKAKAKIFVGLHVASTPQIHYQGADQQQAEESEDPAVPLEHAKHASHIAYMREVHKAAPFDAAAQWDAGIDEMTAQL